MVRLYKLINNTAAIITIVNAAAAKKPSTSPTWWNELTDNNKPKDNKWPQPPKLQKWKSEESGKHTTTHTIKKRIQLIASNTNTKKSDKRTTPIINPKKSSNKRRNTSHKTTHLPTRPIFATPKRKNSIEWQYTSYKLFPTEPTYKHDNNTPLDHNPLFHNINRLINATSITIDIALNHFHHETVRNHVQTKTPHSPPPFSLSPPHPSPTQTQLQRDPLFDEINLLLHKTSIIIDEALWNFHTTTEHTTHNNHAIDLS